MKKKLVFLIVILILGLGVISPVHAANYTMKELIPEGITTTIRGDNLLYKDIVYKDGVISTSYVKNNAKEAKKLSVSIALFDEDKKNVGTINYCSEALNPNEKKDKFIIDVSSTYLVKGKTYKDVKYIAVLSENENCRTGGATEYEGQTIEKIGMPKNTGIGDKAERLLLVVKIVVVIIVGLFLYRFLFTTAYQNMDGTDVRQEYKYINKSLRKERERELKRNPPQPKEVKKVKTDEVIQQEEIENKKSENQESDLFDMYNK